MGQQDQGPTVDELTARFGIGEEVRFDAGPGGLTCVELHGAHGRATVALHGGHVLAYEPLGQAPVLWVSRNSEFAPGKPIRGGVPVCWPWFGPHPTDRSKPNHGFARLLPWTVHESQTLEGGEVLVQLGLAESEATQAIWPHRFDLRLTVRLGAGLRLTLTTQSYEEKAPLTITSALHTYFAVGDAGRVTVHGLEGVDYLDKAGDGGRKTQQGPITIEAETDRVYLDTAGEVVIEDPVVGRRLRNKKRGSRSTVVWNPWRDRAGRLPDFGAEEYREMLCVETANAADDAVTLAPGEAHELEAIISAEPSGPDR
jgi:D-hexose-6-phosphate mutarotase